MASTNLYKVRYTKGGLRVFTAFVHAISHLNAADQFMGCVVLSVLRVD